MKISKNVANIDEIQFLSPNIPDDSDTKSIRSTGDIINSTNISKIRKKRLGSVQI